jgi:LPS sulfotransferase NodH
VAWQSFSRTLIVVVLLAAGGCAGKTRTWLVKPHQRAYLADRIMRLDANAQQKKADQHVMVYREGAVGGDGTAGGGCGCN